MPQVIQGQLGGHVSIKLTSREVRDDSLDGQPFTVNGIRFTSIKDPNGAALSAGSVPSWNVLGAGRYITHFDTSGLSAGDYECQIEVGIAFSAQAGGVEKKARKDFVLRLVEFGNP